ncbi:MAG: integral rane sensor signal transduction histidine kinase [Chitinophagaceae bacterium]|nr:integral rane sensor signal transduction histidine kinase [Chitinophagaceae bacterium]
MNLYEKKRRWKFLLLAFAVLIAATSLWYTKYLVKNISINERTRAEVWAMTIKNIAEMPDINDEFITYISAVRDSLTLPAMIVSSTGSIIMHRGLDNTKTPNEFETDKKYDPKYFRNQLKEMKNQHPDPIVINLARNSGKWLVYYKDTPLLTQLRIFPYIQLTVIAVFLLLAYLVFSSARRSEQNQVWVGMAKETAHQLGTPISSMMAWIELIKSKFEADHDPLILEMENDIKRLEMVADRFSKIGSKPILQSNIVYRVIKDYADYFRVRTSDKIELKVTGDKSVEALMNVPLFDWVLENLLKNAVNAIEGPGLIELKVTENLVKEQVFIDICDTGKGIPKPRHETIFQPGYTTRKRGWGLGLSLSKRIIENYHKGQIFVKESESGKGTVIRIIIKSSLTYVPTTT